MDLCSNKKLCYKGVSDESKKQLEELNECDDKFNNLVLNKILEFGSENKILKDKNKNSQIELQVLNKSLRKKQKESENCKESFKKLQKENKDLLAKLQSSKKELENIGADLSKNEQKIIGKVKEENANDKNHSSSKSTTNEGLLIMYHVLQF